LCFIYLKSIIKRRIEATKGILEKTLHLTSKRGNNGTG